MTQRVEMIDSRHPDERIILTMPERYVRQTIPMLAALQGLVNRRYGFEIRFTPPIHVENEASREHFWLGTPPPGTRLAAYFNIPPNNTPIIFAALGAAIEEGYI